MSKFRITEFDPIDVEDGYLIDGFPSAGITSAIATESLIHTTQFEQAGIIDSDMFPAVSLINKGVPSHPTRIFVKKDLKVVVFSSYLTLHESLHKPMARFMLKWAKDHKIKQIITCVATNAPEQSEEIIAAASTESLRTKLKESGIAILQHGTIPGLAGALLNQGALLNIDVAAVLYNTTLRGPDFKSSAQLCMAMSKLVPGVSCDISALNLQAQKAEKNIKEADGEARHLKDSMYR